MFGCNTGEWQVKLTVLGNNLFYIYDNSNSKYIFTIDQSVGYIGIGDDHITPEERLHINDGVLKISAGTESSRNRPETISDAAYFWHQNGIGPTISGNKFQIRTGAGHTNMPL